jgi:hypothetical protein
MTPLLSKKLYIDAISDALDFARSIVVKSVKIHDTSEEQHRSSLKN